MTLISVSGLWRSVVRCLVFLLLRKGLTMCTDDCPFVADSDATVAARRDGMSSRVFVEFPRGKQPVVHRGGVPVCGNYLLIHVGEGGSYPQRFFFVESALAVSSYVGGSGSKLLLRNLRCQGRTYRDGDQTCFLWCAVCGFRRREHPADIVAADLKRCPGCKAVVSRFVCPLFHTFGRCALCEDRELEAVPPEFDRPLRSA